MNKMQSMKKRRNKMHHSMIKMMTLVGVRGGGGERREL